MERITCPNCKFPFDSQLAATPIDTSAISTTWVATIARDQVRAWFADGGRWDGWMPSKQVYVQYREWARTAAPRYRMANVANKAIGMALVDLGGARKRISAGNAYSVAGLDTSVLEAEDAVRF